MNFRNRLLTAFLGILLTIYLAGCSENGSDPVETGSSVPVADAGMNQDVARGAIVTLDGSSSSDADEDSLTFSWSLTSKPSGSEAVLTGATTAAPTFTVDFPGSYVVSLVVSDGTNVSEVDLVTVTAHASGSLDTSFGSGGIVVTNSGENESAEAVALQADGKIVIAGFSRGNTVDFALLRYNAEGTPDTSFGPTGTGMVLTDMQGDHDTASSLVIQSDGKIVAAGSATVDTSDFALARYNADGTLDAAFGTGGKVTTDVTGGSDIGRAVALQTDGKIVMAGQANDDFGVVRYNSDGSLDTTFGTDGKVTADIAGSANSIGDVALALAIQSDGKIVVAGYAFFSTNDIALMRFNADGTLDSSFGSGGIVVTDNGGNFDMAYGMTIQPDGRIIVAGYSYNNNIVSSFTLWRYDTNGTLDASFGSSGITSTNPSLSGDNSYAYAVALQPDGKILAAGQAFDYIDDGDDTNDSDNFALVNFLSDGQPDNAFGSHGTGAVTTDLTGLDDYLKALVLQPDGRIVLVGSAFNGEDEDFALVRYWP